MPDYAEVAGCSSFKNPSSPTYDTFGAYATTTLVGRQFPKNSYSAPNSVHYNNFINNNGNNVGNGNHQIAQQQPPPQFNHMNGNGSSISMSNNQLKMNIIENKMEQLMNNLNNPNTPSALAMQQQQQHQGKNGAKSVPQTPLLSTMRRNRLLNNSPSNNNNNNGSINSSIKSNKLSSYVGGSDVLGSGKLSMTFCNDDQPLFMKSKFDGSWTSIPSTTALTSSTTTSNNNSPSHLPSSYHASPRHHHTSMQSSLNNGGNSMGGGEMTKAGNLHSYLSSFGKSDKV